MTHKTDKSMDVLMISFLVVVHGVFWFAVGLGFGRGLWNI